ncbi:MAG: hypothetical protein R2850_07185 [Bacteroidia bacterium]
MKIAIFSTHVLLATHYETELEIITNHQNAGDEIVQVICNADLPACDTNPYFQPEACNRCISKRKLGAGLLEKPVRTVPFMKFIGQEDRKFVSGHMKSFGSIAELKKYQVDNLDVGYAIASSIISYYRDPHPALMEQEIRRYMAGTLAMYRATINFIRTEKPDVVYIFNGRLAHTKAIMRACQREGTTFRIHERGHSFKYYGVFENFTFHQISYIQKEIVKLWSSAGEAERVEKAEQFFTKRMQGQATNWHAFNKDAVDELPAGWDGEKMNIAIFNSSEDEVASISDEWKNPIYQNQLDAIKRIVSDSAHRPDIHFYLRIHPNLRNVQNNELDELLNLSASNLTIIPPESKLNTYFLVKKVSKVITFGSTVGIESAYLGVPSILAGKCFYRNMGSTYDPESHEEMMELILRKLEPKDKLAALQFGYFFSSFGIPYQYYEAKDFGTGTFRSHSLGFKPDLQYKLISWLFGNIKAGNLSERLRLRLREKVLNRLLN